MHFQADRRKHPKQQTPRYLIDTSARSSYTHPIFIPSIRVLGLMAWCYCHWDADVPAPRHAASHPVTVIIAAATVLGRLAQNLQNVMQSELHVPLSNLTRCQYFQPPQPLQKRQKTPRLCRKSSTESIRKNTWNISSYLDLLSAIRHSPFSHFWSRPQGRTSCIRMYNISKRRKDFYSNLDWYMSIRIRVYFWFLCGNSWFAFYSFTFFYGSWNFWWETSCFWKYDT